MKIEINANIAKENTKKVLNTVSQKASGVLSFFGITVSK